MDELIYIIKHSLLIIGITVIYMLIAFVFFNNVTLTEFILSMNKPMVTAFLFGAMGTWFFASLIYHIRK